MTSGIVFDAYGTLLDVYAAEQRLEALFPGKGRAISQLWRVRQIDYTRMTTMSGLWRDFAAITGDALDYACEAEGAALTAATRAELLAFYDRLPPHPEVPAALAKLHARGLPLGVLTNGDGAMVGKALEAAGIAGLFTHVLSVERVRKFKTAPETYQLGLDAFGVPAKDLVFVSSNGWDAAASAAFGYRAFWINRLGAPRERFGSAPAGEGRTMDDLVGWA